MIEPCDILRLLAASHIRPTPRKRAVLAAVQYSTIPLTAADVHTAVARTLPIDLATVYRTLSLLSERGIVRAVPDGSGVVRYEMACEHNPVHPHFRCEACGETTCLKEGGPELAAVLRRAARGAQVRDISIILTGICPACREVAE